MARIDRAVAILLGLLLLLNLSDLNPLLAIQQYSVAYNQAVDALLTTWGIGILLIYPLTALLLIYGFTGRKHLSTFL